MKKVTTLLLLFCLVLSASAGCAETAADYTTGSPWICADLDGTVTAETPAELKDDFYLYVNKEELLELEIPQGYPFAGTVMDLVLKQGDDLRNLFEKAEPRTHDEHLAVNLYQLYMDWDTRNALGVAPLKEMVNLVEEIDSTEALKAYFAETPLDKQLYRLIRFSSETSMVDATRYDLTVKGASLMLGDSAEYAELTDYGMIRKESNRELSGKMLVKLGYSAEEAEAMFENCLAFESLLAAAIPTNEEQKKPEFQKQLFENTVNRETLKEKAGDFPLLDMIEKNAGYPEAERYVLYGAEYPSVLAGLCNEENLERIKDCLIVHGVNSWSSSLDRECYEWSVECSNMINGASGILDDETVFSSLTNSRLEWPVAQLYCSTYLQPGDKERVTAIVEQVVDAYHGIIREADFLSEETKEKAIEKLDSLGTNVLYPDDWAPYSMEGLDFASAAEGGTLVEALKAISAYNLADSVKEFSQPVDRTRWEITPVEINCFYNPSTNSIYILAAFAQGQMYNSGMSNEEIMAKIGMVIGHEISHAFDSSGGQYDKDGNLKNWWTEEDYARFREKNQKLADYFSAISVWEGQHILGSIVTGETCADMAGLKCMLKIASGTENFDYDLFFRSYSKVFLSKNTLQRVLTLLKDEHPFGYLRVNCVLQQFDEFLDYYGIIEGDGMYLAPEERVAIW